MTTKYNGIIIERTLYGERIDFFNSETAYQAIKNEIFLRDDNVDSKWVDIPKTRSKLIKMINKEIDDTWAGNN